MDPTYTGPKIEAHGNLDSHVADSHVAPVPHELELKDQGEEGRGYGSRWVETLDKDGRTVVQEVPLRWEDLFDPQEGDRLMHSPDHGQTLRNAGARFDCFFDAQGKGDVLVLDDVLITWKTPGVAPACPDVAVILGMKRKWPKGPKAPKSFDEALEGTGPCFVLEVTSRATATYDRTKKPAIYRKAKVPDIFQLDELKSPWELKGERLNPKTGRYLKVRPDGRGRWLAETLGVYFSISADGYDLILEDAVTGEVLRKPIAESRARRAAERQAAVEAEGREAEAAARRQEAKARRKAEEENLEMAAEIERLRAQLGGREEGEA
jgi:Uma2 family endonuclease